MATNRDISLPDSDVNQQQDSARSKSTRGFASMDPEKQREIARKGGRAAHLKGTAHEFTPEEARLAGRKGGEAVSRDRQHMAEIGREGGQARGARAALRNQPNGNIHNLNRGQANQPTMGMGGDRSAIGEGNVGPNIGQTDKDYSQGGAM